MTEPQPDPVPPSADLQGLAEDFADGAGVAAVEAFNAQRVLDGYRPIVEGE